MIWNESFISFIRIFPANFVVTYDLHEKQSTLIFHFWFLDLPEPEPEPNRQQ